MSYSVKIFMKIWKVSHKAHKEHKGLKMNENEFDTVHFKQLLTYLKLTNKKLGLLINFNKELLKDGIKRVINGTIS